MAAAAAHLLKQETNNQTPFSRHSRNGKTPPNFVPKMRLFATAKQHLIACRNRAQTYPQKLPNAPSEFLAQISLFLSPVCLLQLLFGGSKLQASGFQKGPFATAKQHLIACRNRAQTYPQKLPNAPSEFLENIYLFLSPAALVWWLQTASIRLQASRRDPSPQQNST